MDTGPFCTRLKKTNYHHELIATVKKYKNDYKKKGHRPRLGVTVIV